MDAYHKKSVEILIPKLESKSMISTVVVLGLTKHLLSPRSSSALRANDALVTGVNFQQYLFGFSAFFNAQAHRGLVQGSGVAGNFLTSLDEASFWSVVRQDIDMSLANQ